MKIKMIATDMDGTLLDSKKNMPEGFFDWVSEHKDVKFVIASGRQYYALKRDFVPIHDRLIYIAENGALIFQHDEIIHCDEMPREAVLYCLDLIDKMPYAKAVPCGANSAYIENPTDHEWEVCTMFCGRLEKTDNVRKAIENDRIVKIAIYYDAEDAEMHTGEFASLPNHIISVLSGVSWIDISTDTVNKGEAMKVIQKKYDIDSKYCMAFGDYFNDVELLEACGESYCMESGHPDVFKHAKYIAPSNDDNGVMRVLNNGMYEY
ncbi:MAG: HAD family hydrolase [Lachnospiraceae bacterium]|nr:HAD family hydrolase [Lachnospiraceae bacterium]